MIYDVLPVNNYTGNNSTTVFDFNFYIENENQLKVYLINSDNAQIELIYGKDYSINEFGNENGSYITFPISSSTYDVLADNQNISLNLYLPILQQTQYENSSLLNLESLEYSLDYLTRLIQILSRKIELCIKVTEGSNLTADKLLLDIYDKASQVAQNYSATMASADEIKNNIILAQNLITNLNNLISQSVDDIKDEAEKQINSIKNVGFYMNDGKLYYKDENNNYVEFKVLAGFPLLFSTLSDYVMNDLSWLNASNFSYHNASAYQSVYDLLLAEYNSEESIEKTENNITYKLTPKGFKIADNSQEQAVLDLYNSTGVAWYYILDNTNQRFKLPRYNKEGFYLYFYVGEYSSDAVEQVAGLNAEILNNKLDIASPQAQAPYVKTTYTNGTSGYRIWSDGYCEQWGYQAGNGAYGVVGVTLLKTFKDLSYVVYGSTIDFGTDTSWYVATFSTTGNATTDISGVITLKTVNSFYFQSRGSRYWKASGYLAEGEY